MKNIIYTIFLFFALTSCINDDSRDANTLLPELSIEGSDSEEMPVYNVYFGTESLVIDPKVKATSKNLKYEWSVGEYNTILLKRKVHITYILPLPMISLEM